MAGPHALRIHSLFREQRPAPLFQQHVMGFFNIWYYPTLQSISVSRTGGFKDVRATSDILTRWPSDRNPEGMCPFPFTLSRPKRAPTILDTLEESRPSLLKTLLVAIEENCIVWEIWCHFPCWKRRKPLRWID